MHMLENEGERSVQNLLYYRATSHFFDVNVRCNCWGFILIKNWEIFYYISQICEIYKPTYYGITLPTSQHSHDTCYLILSGAIKGKVTPD